jgi:hypothetical protein
MGLGALQKLAEAAPSERCSQVQKLLISQALTRRFDSHPLAEIPL